MRFLCVSNAFPMRFLCFSYAPRILLLCFSEAPPLLHPRLPYLVRSASDSHAENVAGFAAAGRSFLRRAHSRTHRAQGAGACATTPTTTRKGRTSVTGAGFFGGRKMPSQNHVILEAAAAVPPHTSRIERDRAPCRAVGQDCEARPRDGHGGRGHGDDHDTQMPKADRGSHARTSDADAVADAVAVVDDRSSVSGTVHVAFRSLRSRRSLRSLTVFAALRSVRLTRRRPEPAAPAAAGPDARGGCARRRPC